jgi:hypothetical protein
VQERTAAQVAELQTRLKDLEREKKVLLEKSELQSKSKISEQGSLEKRLEKATEENGRLTEELEALKAEKETRYAEY